jgi:hypothetical protein
VDRARLTLATEVRCLCIRRPKCSKCKTWQNHVVGMTTLCCKAQPEWHPYVGEDTALELEHAKELGKPIIYIEE